MLNSKQQTGSTSDKHEQIMRDIQRRIRQEQTANPRCRNAVRNAKMVYPAKPADIPYSISLYQHLDVAQNKLPDYGRTLELRSNILAKIPLLGSLFQAIQLRLHQIALFYTLRAQRHQQDINQHLLESIEQLTAENQKQKRAIIQLQEQLIAVQEKTE